jgi:flagellar protein FliO/FliZ
LDLTAFAQFLTVIFLFIVILVLTYFTTRFIAGYQKNHSVNTNIESVEVMRLSPSQYVQIIRIGQKYVAIAVSKDSIEKLCELSSEDVEAISQEVTSMNSFRDIMDKIKQGLQR